MFKVDFRVAIPVLLAGVFWAGASYSKVVFVQPGDTLWSIAKGTRSDHVSIREQAEAIFEANPHAFSDSTMNSLLYGVRLTLPEAASASSENRVQSDHSVDRDTKAAESLKMITIIRGVSMQQEHLRY